MSRAVVTVAMAVVISGCQSWSGMDLSTVNDKT